MSCLQGFRYLTALRFHASGGREVAPRSHVLQPVLGPLPGYRRTVATMQPRPFAVLGRCWLQEPVELAPDLTLEPLGMPLRFERERSTSCSSSASSWASSRSPRSCRLCDETPRRATTHGSAAGRLRARSGVVAAPRVPPEHDHDDERRGHPEASFFLDPSSRRGEKRLHDPLLDEDRERRSQDHTRGCGTHPDRQRPAFGQCGAERRGRDDEGEEPCDEERRLERALVEPAGAPDGERLEKPEKESRDGGDGRNAPRSHEAKL